MTILDKILLEKEREVPQLKNTPLLDGERTGVPTLKQRLTEANHLQVISEIKRASPSKGEIQIGVDPVEQAKQYEANGAAAISVLTDQTFFKGSLQDLRDVREVVNIPILCKDFIIDPIQIDHAKAAGANIILLIAAALTDENFRKLNDYAKNAGLEVLAEVHDGAEMKRVIAAGADIIGINNRDLKTFKVDLTVTEKLAHLALDAGKVLISESGMKTGDDARRAADAGATGILVGETLMLTDDIAGAFKSFQVPLRVEK